MLGNEIIIPTDIVFGNLESTWETFLSNVKYTEFMNERMHREHRIAQKQLACLEKWQKRVLQPKGENHTYWKRCVILRKKNPFCSFID